MARSTRRRTAIAGAVLAAAHLMATAHAGEQLEELVVTAQKHEQGINEVGITINAFSGEQLKDMNVKTTQDLALHTPGLTVNETAALGVPVYTIRGVGFQDYNPGSSSTVGLYFDEVSIPYAVMTRGAVFDIDRVEVLKGPQGDLYGRNTTAGSINVINKKPTDDFEAGFTTSYGRFETFDLEAFASGPIVDGVKGRIAGKTIQSGEGWQKSLTRDDELGEQDVGAVRGMLDIEPAENIGILLNAHYIKDEGDNIAPTAYDGTIVGNPEFQAPYTPLEDYRLPGGAYFGQTPPWYSTDDNEAADWTNTATTLRNGYLQNVDIRPKRDNELKGGSMRIDWDINDAISFTSLTAYDEFDRTERFEGDGGAFNDSGNINQSDIEVFSQELRLTGKTDELLWIAGLYYSSDDLHEWYNYFMRDSVYGNGSIPWAFSPFMFSPILELDTKYSQETDSMAAYGHVEWNFTEKWRLTLGLRYTEEDREWKGCTYDVGDGTLSGFLNFAFGSTLPPGSCGTVDDIPGSPYNFLDLAAAGADVNQAFHPYTDDINTEKWMWKAGLDYAFTDDILAYLTVSTGFKSGGFNGANSNAQTQLIPYTEEELTSYELGVKATLLDGSMQLNAATFYYDYQDKQEQDLAVTFVGNISGLTNVPESEVTGAELEMNWLPLQGLSVNLGVAWLDTEVKEWDAVDPASRWPTVIYFDASGQELAMSPEWQYNGTVQYQWNITDALVMAVAGDVSYKDDTAGPFIAQAVEDYTVMNARVSLEADDGKWRGTLWSNNIADEDYYVAGFVGNGPYSRINGMPRTYGVTLEYNF